MCNNKIACAIDPGIKGGIAVVSNDIIFETHRMPTFTIDLPPKKKGGKIRKQEQIDFSKLVEIISNIQDQHDPLFYIEDITHLYGLPSTSNFRLGYCVGMAHAAVQLFNEYYLVKPVVWQKIWCKLDIVPLMKKDKIVYVKRGKTLVEKKDTKKTSLKCAKRLYQDHNFDKITDGEIDAILIAKYGLNL